MSWGGKRPGAGRPKGPETVRLSFQVSPETRDAARYLRRQGVDVKALVVREIRTAARMKLEGSL